MLRFPLLCVTLLLLTFFTPGRSQSIDHYESVFYSDASFAYWSSNQGEPDAGWRANGFDDSGWTMGNGGIGYGDDDDGTVIDVCNALMLRKTFHITNLTAVEQLLLFVDYDDAIVAYLNGIEIARSAGLNGAYPAYNQLSTAQHEAGAREKFAVEAALLKNHLKSGQNTLAIQVHNASATSSDLSSNTDLIIALNHATLEYLPTPAWFTHSVFTSSNLPILVMDTHNQNIPDDPKITASLGIIYNGEGQRNTLTDPFNHFQGSIGIELRGNSTQNLPKKPYNFETRDSLGENLNVSILGMPEENDWVLRASYLDHTFIRNALASHLSRQMGHWAFGCRHVEVVINGEYQGIYILMEKLKKDKNRLDIATLTLNDITAPEITGGYIFEITGFGNDLGESRELKYPDMDEVAPEQLAYIRNYDNSFRDVMRSGNYMDEQTGYKAWIDDDSFVDELLVQEAMRNSDAYGWSGYFHKDKNEKLKAGPVWDFDQSAGNSSYPDNGVSDRWLFSHSSTSNTPFFWPLLFEDPAFAYKTRVRWESMRSGAFHTTTLLAYIDSIAGMLTEAQAREFAKWPVLGKNVWRETYGYQDRDTYQKEVDYLKSFLTQRWNWMDQELAAIENPNPVSIVNKVDRSKVHLQVYPNPARSVVYFKVQVETPTEATVQLYNLQGGLVQTFPPNALQPGSTSIRCAFNANLTPGMYVYKITLDQHTEIVGKLVKQ